MERRRTLSLNEWAVLGLLVEAPRHGYDVAVELRPGAEVGQVWHLERRLVYRAIERLVALGFAEARGDEPGAAGPRRTRYGATRAGRRVLRRWLDTPVEHLRELRSGFLLKLTLGRRLGADPATLVARQRATLEGPFAALASTAAGDDPVERWRHHSAEAARRFLAELAG